MATRLLEQNLVMLSGRATKDAFYSGKGGGSDLCAFDMAANHRYKAQDGEWKDAPCFVPIVVFGKAAEPIAARIKKGVAVHVEGRLNNNQWEDKEGNKRSTLQVIANRVQVLTKAEDASGQAERATDNNNDDVPF